MIMVLEDLDYSQLEPYHEQKWATFQFPIGQMTVWAVGKVKERGDEWKMAITRGKEGIEQDDEMIRGEPCMVRSTNGAENV